MNEVITAVLGVLAILVPVDVWLFAQLFRGVKDDIKLMKAGLVNQMVCQHHTDKINELIRGLNAMEHSVKHYKYAVTKCIYIIKDKAGIEVEIERNDNDPDRIAEL